MARSWAERHAAASDVFVPWIRQHVELDGARVVDFGCGSGSMSLALAPHVEHMLCLDEDAGSVEECRQRLDDAGFVDVATEAGNSDALVTAVERVAGTVDVFVLFAVLEHMTIAERLTTLRAAAQALTADGTIIVAETPNRLLWNDYHTTETPFFGMLPDELAIELAGSIRRTDITDSLLAPGQTGSQRAMRLARWGRGVSHHEFEAVFGPRVHDHVIATGWDPELAPERHQHREELYLDRFLSEAEPNVAPCFSRYWLDLIIQPSSRDQRPLPRPVPLHTLTSRDAVVTPWETVIVSSGGHLRLELRAATTRVAVNVVVGPEHRERGPAATLVADDARHTYVLAAHDPAQWIQHIVLDVTRPCESIVLESIDARLEIFSVLTWPEVARERLDAMVLREAEIEVSPPSPPIAPAGR